MGTIPRLLPAVLSIVVLSMVVTDSYALGTPHPISSQPLLVMNYITILLAVVFYIFLRHLIRRSFDSRYKLTP